MAPKLCGSKRGTKNSLRKRASSEIKQDEKASEECKRPRLIATDDEKKHTKRLEKMETQRSSDVEEKQIIDGSNNPPEVVSRQNPDNEVSDNSITVESKIIPSFGKKSATGITATKAEDQKELSSTRKSQLEEKVVKPEENTVKYDSDESGYSPEEFEDIVKSFVYNILDLASKTTSANCDVALSMISKETARLLKDSRYGTYAEISKESSVDHCKGKQKVDAKTSSITAEHSVKKSETTLSQSGTHVNESKPMLNKAEVKQAVGEKVDTKRDDVTTESQIDLRKARKENDDSNGGCVVNADGNNVQSEEEDASCASSNFTIKSTVQNVSSKANKGDEAVLQQSEQDGRQRDNDVPSDQQTTAVVETDLAECNTSHEEKERTEGNVDKIQQNESRASKGSDELPKQEDIVSEDAKSLSASDTDKATTSSSLRSLQANPNEGDLPGCVDLLDFTSSQLLQIEEVETEMIQQEENGPNSKGEGTSQSIQRVQDEDIESIASRRREEERRDDRRVKEIMQKMMKDLNEIKLVTGSLLSQMTQYRKHRSQRQPQPSRMTGTHATTSGFYRGKLSKGSGSSQFKKS